MHNLSFQLLTDAENLHRRDRTTSSRLSLCDRALVLAMHGEQPNEYAGRLRFDARQQHGTTTIAFIKRLSVSDWSVSPDPPCDPNNGAAVVFGRGTDHRHTSSTRASSSLDAPRRRAKFCSSCSFSASLMREIIQSKHLCEGGMVQGSQVHHHRHFCLTSNRRGTWGALHLARIDRRLQFKFDTQLRSLERSFPRDKYTSLNGGKTRDTIRLYNSLSRGECGGLSDDSFDYDMNVICRINAILDGGQERSKHSTSLLRERHAHVVLEVLRGGVKLVLNELGVGALHHLDAVNGSH